MENAPRNAFAGASPVARTNTDAPPLVLRPEQLSEPPPPVPVPGAWLISALAADTRVMTPAGPRPADHLALGDPVLALDHGPLRVLWVGRRSVTAGQIAAFPEVAPIRVPRAALGGGSPRRPVLLSPGAGVLLCPAGAPEGLLVPARDLCGHAGIAPAPEATVTYVQLLLERHAVIAAEGLAVESFHPRWLGDAPWDSRLRAEVLAVLPELEHDLDLYGPEARPRAARAR